MPASIQVQHVHPHKYRERAFIIVRLVVGHKKELISTYVFSTCHDPGPSCDLYPYHGDHSRHGLPDSHDGNMASSSCSERAL